METLFLLFVQDHIRNAVLTPIMVLASVIGEMGLVWIVISLVLLIIPRTRKVGLMCALALILVLLINNLFIKNLVDRPRPFDVIPGLTVLGSRPHDTSFPSGHTAASFAAMLVIYRNLGRKAGIPALLLALLIALSRMYLGAHYPTDVLGGMVIGLACGLLAEQIVCRLAERIGKKKAVGDNSE